MIRCNLLTIGSVLFVSVGLCSAQNLLSKSASAPAGPLAPDIKPITTKPLVSEAGSSGQGAPTYVLYRHFFHTLAALRQRAKALDKQGKDGTGMRALLYRRLGLTNTQSATVDEIFAEYEANANRKDVEARRIIEAYRKQYPQGKAIGRNDRAPLPASLAKLQTERDQITLRAVARLQTELDTEAFARLNAVVIHDQPHIYVASTGVRH